MTNSPNAKENQFRSRRPMMSVWVASYILDCEETDLVRKVEDGSLPVAWNICRPGANRIFLRLPTCHVWELQKTGKVAPTYTLESILAVVLPVGRSIFLSSELSWILTCSPDHICHLIEDGALVPESTPKPSNQPRRIPRAVIAEFLTLRRFQ